MRKPLAALGAALITGLGLAAVPAVAQASTCTASGQNGTCGAYTYSSPKNPDGYVVNSNGFDTYVINNCWANPSCNLKQTTTDPGNWSVTGSETAGNTGVRDYPDTQQLMNNWTGGGWNGSGTATDTPISKLYSLTSTFSEVMPHNSGTIAEAGYDIWTNYSSDIMIWVDNVNRGTGGASQIGTATIGGQKFTVYQFGGAGGEIIFSLDGSGGTGTFANETSGTVDILATLRWVQAHGYATNITIGQIDFGWELCSTGGSNETFSMKHFTITPGLVAATRLKSPLVLTDTNGATANGSKVVVRAESGTAGSGGVLSNQEWAFVRKSGHYIIELARHKSVCLDVTNGGTTDGTKIELWSCNGSAEQEWQPETNGTLEAVQATAVQGTAMVLDDPNAGGGGTQLQIWRADGNPQQFWAIP